MQPRAEGCSWAAVSVRTKCRHDAILQRQRSRDGSGAQSLGVLGGQTHAGSGSCEHWPGLGVRGWKCGPGWPAYSLAKRECRTGEWEGAGLASRCPRRGRLRPVVSGVEASHGAALSRGQFPTYQSLVGIPYGQDNSLCLFEKCLQRQFTSHTRNQSCYYIFTLHFHIENCDNINLFIELVVNNLFIPPGSK